MSIRRLGVIGAGTMGGGIAALAASAGVPVILLDIPGPGPDRNAVARGGVERAKKAKPAAFMDAERAALIEIGNTEDDLERLARLRPRRRGDHRTARAEARAVRAAREAAARAHDRRVEHVGHSDERCSRRALGVDLRARFLGMHFFNPPRYLHLLEIIPTAETSKRDDRRGAPVQRPHPRQGDRRREGRSRIRRQPARRVRDGARDPPDGEARPHDRRSRRAHRRAHRRARSRRRSARPISRASTSSRTSPKELERGDRRGLRALAMGPRAREGRAASARRAARASTSASARRFTRSTGRRASTRRRRSPRSPELAAPRRAAARRAVRGDPRVGRTANGEFVQRISAALLALRADDDAGRSRTTSRRSITRWSGATRGRPVRSSRWTCSAPSSCAAGSRELGLDEPALLREATRRVLLGRRNAGAVARAAATRTFRASRGEIRLAEFHRPSNRERRVLEHSRRRVADRRRRRRGRARVPQQDEHARRRRDRDDRTARSTAWSATGSRAS